MNFTVEPIGYFSTSKAQPSTAPQQATMASADMIGEIRLMPHKNFEQALQDLSDFSHIWVLYRFHLNEEWKPMVTPPRGTDKKIGVFATRSPHRPNFIGMSCLEVQMIDGLSIYVKGHDILDGTPILDIKPYLPYADSFPKAKTGWIEGVDQSAFNVEYNEHVQSQIKFLMSNGEPNIKEFFITQLTYEPTNAKKKRVVQADDNTWVIAYRTWRATFVINDKKITVTNIFSGYSEAELALPLDQYQDKSLHKRFRSMYGASR